MDAGESWELFDLDTELHVSISEDAKDYLRQFGLEEYNFENYQPTDDPGSYFKDVPRDQNPEALFDDLTRESIRRNSGRTSAWSTRSNLTNGKAASTKAGHVTSTSNRHSAHQVSKPPEASTVPRPAPRVDNTVKNEESPKSGAKRVSFTEQVEKESPVRKQKDDAELHQKHLKTMTNFFGRPKVKSNKKTTQKHDNITSNTINDLDEQQQHQQQQQQQHQHQQQHQQQGKGKSIENPSQKKGKKFKFPAFDMMRHKKANNLRPTEPKIEDIEPNTAQHPSTSAASSPVKQTPPSNGLQTLDLLSHSPELPEVGLTNIIHQPECEQEPDIDTIEKTAINEKIAAVVETDSRHDQTDSRSFGVADVKPNGLNGSIIEMVSFQEEVNGKSEGDGLDGILVGDQLHPALLAAVHGDLHLLNEMCQSLSSEVMLKVQDDRGNTLLHASATTGQLPCVEYLCGRCPHLAVTENKAHLSPTAMAIKHGQIEVVDWLLENLNLRHEFFPSTARRRCLLHHAAKFGQDGCLRLLLSKLESSPEEVEFSDQHGNTPAHMAAKYGHILCLQTLVEYGFDVCSANQYHHTPCYYADFNNHRHCAGYLMVVETCTQLATHHVQQSRHADWLVNRNEAICAFTSEALRLSSGIARQSADDVDVTYRLQQTLDDAMDLVSDVTAQLKHLYEENSSLRETNNNSIQSSTLGQTEVEESLERAADLQRHLESFDSIVNHQRARQQILRVKEVQRRWEKLLQEDQVPDIRDEQLLVKQVLRERFSDAVQRLLVYRTTQDSSKNILSPYHHVPNSSLYSNSPNNSPQHSITSSHQFTPPHHPTTSSHHHHHHHPTTSHHHHHHPHPTTSPSPKHHRSPSSRDSKQPTHIDQMSLGLDSPSRVIKDEDFLLRLSPRARGEGTRGSLAYSLHDPETTKLPREVTTSPASTESSQKNPPGGSTSNIDDVSLDRSSTSSSSGGNHGNSPRNDKTRSSSEPKNNVVESFLKDRLFYQQDQESHSGKKAASTGIFYAATVPSAPSSTTSSDSPRLKFSEFSAFNRVSNRAQGEGQGEAQSIDGRTGTTDVSGGCFKISKNLRSLEPEVTESLNAESEQSHRSNPAERRDPSMNVNETKLTVANLNKHNENENISHVKSMISQLEKRKEGPSTVLSELRDCNEEGATSTTRETLQEISPSEQNSISTIKILQNSREIPPEHTWGSETSSEEQSEEQSEDLSDLDLGPELQGDDLMLGPHGFLDDELEDGEEYADEIFSPEELLALTPGGRLPLSMQFETSLSTIEEVSVVSVSTRADGETDNENTTPGAVDLDASTDSDGTITSDTDDQKPEQSNDGNRTEELTLNNVGDTEFASSERPWYEMSDDEEGGPSTRLQIPRHQLKEHFTIF